MGAEGLAEWGEFGVAMVGAAAALAGLSFVAISINLDRILAGPGLTGRAAEAVITLLAALVGASLLLVPFDDLATLGFVWVVLAAIYGLLELRSHVRAARTHAVPTAIIGGRIALHQSATLLWVVAGLALALPLPGGLFWVAPAVLWTIGVGISDAWVLLIEILR